MLGKPLVRFCEGRGGNWTKASPATVWGAPRLLDRIDTKSLLVIFRVISWIVSNAPLGLGNHRPLKTRTLLKGDVNCIFGKCRVRLTIIGLTIRAAYYLNDSEVLKKRKTTADG